MVKHIGQAVAALTLKYTVQHAGIVTEKHRLIVMNALSLNNRASNSLFQLKGP